MTIGGSGGRATLLATWAGVVQVHRAGRRRRSDAWRAGQSGPQGACGTSKPRYVEKVGGEGYDG